MNKNDIKLYLSDLGLKKGDVVLLHASLSSIGEVEDGAKAVVDAFLETIGEDGTLVVPGFNQLGLIPEYVKNMKNSIKSVHPLASVCAIGAKADEICVDHYKQETAFGQGTPYEKISKMGGLVCLLGVDQQSNSSLHYAEAILKLEYLKTSSEITFETPEGELTKSWSFHPGLTKDFLKLDKYLIEEDLINVIEIGNAIVKLMPIKEVLELAIHLGTEDSAIFLSSNPSCHDSVLQRAKLSQGLIAREIFSLITSSSLAGWYVPQIIDEMLSVGIDLVSIDLLQGRPIHKIKPSGIETAVNDFRRHGCEVASLRLIKVPKEYESIIKIAKDNEIPRIVMPLFNGLEGLLETAEKIGIKISFYNALISSEMASEILIKYHRKGYTPGFCFNSANFTKVYEKPYFQSYRQKLHNYVDQMDLEDCTFDGIQKSIGEGNSNIKELISLLRCRSFTGNLVLSGNNRNIGDLKDCVNHFVKLLKSM
ncbi:MAG: hypothetical protein COA79_11020 [Planctomycetota bacterium]|nr:MAG: hypothetical protein COA79_11020 [Planctomycetota bacterium]